MFETIYRNLDNTLRKDAGCSGEMGYIAKITDDKVLSDSNLKFVER